MHQCTKQKLVWLQSAKFNCTFLPGISKYCNCVYILHHQCCSPAALSIVYRLHKTARAVSNKGQNQGHSSRTFMVVLLDNSFASKQDFGTFYLPKKFHTFWCSLSTKKCWWTGCCENGCPAFRTSFALAAFISHRKRKNFGNCTLAYD